MRWRLAVLCHVEEVAGNADMTCRYFGITRQTYYNWLRRYRAEGTDGPRDRSKRPRTIPNATRAEVIEVYLKRYHDVTISKSGVWHILDRLDMSRLPASQRYKRHDRRWKRYEKQRPGHHVQIDVKFVEPLPGSGKHKPGATPVGRRGKFCQYTAFDDCTRLRVLNVYPDNNQKTAVQFLDYVLSQLPFAVETIQTDNGAEFQSAFHWHVLDKGINHIYI
ncbi:helix-turn-helix domain-containing protein [Amycolatopsis acidicola]|uniref:helix-turn-helix domain-containing protein n=1 Tax=Amycolatopsis acidicola TaxID=2596893 RepID=UPI002441E1F3|nr:leucine zipper domain-containing protein [Amycolatopsis acidicola]